MKIRTIVSLLSIHPVPVHRRMSRSFRFSILSAVGLVASVLCSAPANGQEPARAPELSVDVSRKVKSAARNTDAVLAPGKPPKATLKPSELKGLSPAFDVKGRKVKVEVKSAALRAAPGLTESLTFRELRSAKSRKGVQAKPEKMALPAARP